MGVVMMEVLTLGAKPYPSEWRILDNQIWI